MGLVADRIAEQIQGELTGFDSEIARLDGEIAELSERREALATQREEARELLAHHRKDRRP